MTLVYCQKIVTYSVKSKLNTTEILKSVFFYGLLYDSDDGKTVIAAVVDYDVACCFS